MVFHSKLTPEGIHKLINKYVYDQLNAGNYHVDGNELHILNHYFDQPYCVPVAISESGNVSEEAILEFKNGLKGYL